MTYRHPVLGSASDWSCHEENLPQPIRSTGQIRVVTSDQSGISALASQRHLAEKPAMAMSSVFSGYSVQKESWFPGSQKKKEIHQTFLAWKHDITPHCDDALE